MDDRTVIEIAANPDSAKEGILMDALDDAGYAMTADVLRSYKDEANAIQLEYWRARLSGEREIWIPSDVERYWVHIHTLRKTNND